MVYKRIYAWETDYEIFLELKRLKNIEFKRNLSDVEFFHMLIDDATLFYSYMLQDNALSDKCQIYSSPSSSSSSSSDSDSDSDIIYPNSKSLIRYLSDKSNNFNFDFKKEKGKKKEK